MSLLVRLPEAVSRVIVSEWLNAKCLGPLDSAHCRRKERDAFLLLLSSSTILCEEGLNTTSLCKEAVEWVVKKHVRFLHIITSYSGLTANKLLSLENLIKQTHSSLKRVDYHGNFVQYENASVILGSCSDLEHIVVGKVYVPKGLMHTVASRNQTLRKIELINCENISRAACAAIATNCLLLEVLDMRLSDLDDVGITTIIRQCTKLTALELFGCRSITDKGVLNIAKYGSKLSHLSISDTMATEVGVRAVAQSCPLLRDLNLERVVLTSPDCAAAVGRGCPLLENLSFVGCGVVTGKQHQVVKLGVKHL